MFSNDSVETQSSVSRVVQCGMLCCECWLPNFDLVSFLRGFFFLSLSLSPSLPLYLRFCSPYLLVVLGLAVGIISGDLCLCCLHSAVMLGVTVGVVGGTFFFLFFLNFYLVSFFCA